jgi:chemotaxis protein MotB
MRVVGLSSAVLFDKKDPLNPINRRISVIVMKKHAEESVSSDGPQVDVGQGTAPDPAALLPQSPAAPEASAPAQQKQ